MQAKLASADCVITFSGEIGIKELLKISAEARGASADCVREGSSNCAEAREKIEGVVTYVEILSWC